MGHPPAQQVPLAPELENKVGRQRRRFWILVSVGACCGLICSGLFMAFLAATVFNPEFDGSRPLINGYSLWMLHGGARQILGPSSAGGPDQVAVLPDDPFRLKREVTYYAEVDPYIAGELTSGYFVIDTRLHASEIVATRSEWGSLLRGYGLDADALRLHR